MKGDLLNVSVCDQFYHREESGDHLSLRSMMGMMLSSLIAVVMRISANLSDELFWPVASVVGGPSRNYDHSSMQ